MKSGDYLFDTNIVIYLLRDEIIDLKTNRFFVSVITELELFSYNLLSSEDENNLKKVINVRNIIEIDNDIKEATIKIRKIYNIKLPDAIICATAMAQNLILVTNDNNLKKIIGLKTFSYKELAK